MKTLPTDTIVALTERAENAEVALKAPEVHWECQQKIDALEAEVSRLRAALAEALDIAQYEATYPRPGTGHIARIAELRKLAGDP